MTSSWWKVSRLPVGAITALQGGPVLIFLLLRRGA